ncbi:hypothetical protein OTERR_16350 [Oryzomicrobium terrae]|uniref:DUF1684 domain-containing protein n=1 Tax=Oryzomicrobium terrae TaxID=1735038 RepID=A0A5C1E832_9RHOO|nr:DUF1684 domain-containing protein [Oryzomicrobium terrae]QEL65111.1 hypothetical protein OTERR_16350 [Oryzomicrobium terrae]
MSATPPAASASPATPLARWQHWCARRHAELASPDSWLGLIGLTWLEPGRNRVGSAADGTVVLPDGPAHLGDLLWDGSDGEHLVWQAAPGSPAVVEGGEGPAIEGAGITLATDARGTPSTVTAGDLHFFVIARDGRLAVRLRDRAWQRHHPFAGLDYFAFDPAWQVDAAWERLDPPQILEVPTVTGELKAVQVSGQAVFERDGQRNALLPMEEGEDGYFFVFRDLGAGRDTYGAGRFLHAAPPREGRLVLDFNRAYNPPCAFTPFATCPLPPPENWLKIAIPAGEKKYAGHY